MNEEALAGRILDRIICMAWEVRTPFDAITNQFGLSVGEVILLMRGELEHSSFNLGHKQLNNGFSSTHRQKCHPEVDSFKFSRQRAITNNKISKR